MASTTKSLPRPHQDKDLIPRTSAAILLRRNAVAAREQGTVMHAYISLVLKKCTIIVAEYFIVQFACRPGIDSICFFVGQGLSKNLDDHLAEMQLFQGSPGRLSIGDLVPEKKRANRHEVLFSGIEVAINKGHLTIVRDD